MAFKAKNVFEGVASMLEKKAREPKKKKPADAEVAEDDVPAAKGKKPNPFKKK